MKKTLTFLVASLLLSTTVRADWPQFRGPTGTGHATATGLPLHWSETNNIVWKTEIPHRGWSTPVVMGGQVWLTTATLEGNDFYAICLDAKTGKILFNEKLFHSDNPESLYNAVNVNCYATPTCAIEPGRVYVHFGVYGTACLDTATFKILWKRDDLPCRHYRGPASSLVLFENLLILTMDGVDVQYHVALDKKTGNTIWKTNRSVPWNDEHINTKLAQDGDRRKAHSTPLIVNINGKLQMLSAGAKASYAYDPRDGKELWRFQFPDAWSAAPVPLFSHGLAIIATGWGKTELYGIRPYGSGYVTYTHMAWKFDKGVCKTASPIIVGDLLYMVSDDGFVTCLEVATGNLVWRERIGGTYAASPIYADGHLYFANQQGRTTILNPGRTCDIVATNTLDIGCMASHAVDGEALFLRTKTHLYRIESNMPQK